MTLSAFDDKLKKTNPNDFTDFIDKHIFTPVPEVFGGDLLLYDQFRDRVAAQFDVERTDVIIVGSARLGFSYTNKTKFSLDSDVDVAIVNERLFDEYSKILCAYHHDIIRYKIALDKSEWSQYLLFLKYFAAGWLRPDKGTAVMNKTPNALSWWKYFKSISHGKSEIGNHKVNAGIYKSDYYLRQYLSIGLKDHLNSIILPRLTP